MKYSQEALAEMAAKIDLLEYASHTVEFVRHYKNTHYAVCPFHHEKTASLAVNTDENFFYCFGCGKNGNIYNWIMETEGLSFDQAVKKVASLTNSHFNEYTECESMSFYKQLKKINSNTKTEKESKRTILDIEKDYNQKYSDEVPEEWIAEGISKDELKKYNIRIDHSSNRIVYPVFSNDGELISIKGRTRFENFKQLKIMKYMNYNPIGKLDFFQGMEQALKYIEESGEIIIVEGIKSVMKIDGFGYHNIVSSETSALNEYQIELLIKMHIKNVVIAYDKDVNIKKIRENVQLLKRFTNVYVIYDKANLLEDKDSPCDKGKEAWNKLYNSKIKL